MFRALRARNEWAFFRALPRAYRPLAWLWWGVLVARGLLPAGFAVAMGSLVAAVQAGSANPALGHLAPSLAVAGTLFVLLQVLTPLHQALGRNLGSRMSAWLYDQLMDSCAQPPGLAHLEDEALASELAMARDFDLGISGPPLSISMDFIASGLVEFLAGLTAALLLAAYAWWAPPLLGGAWLATHWLLRESAVWQDRNTDEVREAQRHADYGYRLAVDAPAAKELRLFGLADWTVARFVARRRRLYDLRWAATRLRERPLATSLVLVLGANLLLFTALAHDALAGHISLGELVTFASAAISASMIAFGGLSWALDGAAAPVVATARLQPAMARVGALAAPHGAAAVPVATHGPIGEIRLVDVHFTYPGQSQPVLAGLDLTIPACSSLAIVGQNGAGKTTLAKLLCRLYDPQQGRIEVDGVDLRDIPIDTWRARLAAVFQDFIRFELSLRDNVLPIGGVATAAGGHDTTPTRHLDDAAIHAALADAGVAGRLSLDTVLARGYDGGTELSGGQWQRVALARALCAVRAGGLGFSAAATWFLRVISERTQRRFRDRLTIALESHVARMQATVSTIAHHERPELLDRLAILRDQVFVLDHMYMSLFATCGWLLRLGVTLALLVSVHPLLALLAVFALPTVATSTWRPGVERAAEERGAASMRLSRHLVDLATRPAVGKEVRVLGIADALRKRRRAAFEHWYAEVGHARWRSALWHALAWAVFGAGFVASVVFVAGPLGGGAGAALLVLAAGSRLSAYIGATVGEIGFLRGIWMDGSRRLAWLEDYAAAQEEQCDGAVPAVLGQGIRFEHVDFTYPGTGRRVLEDVNLVFAPGSVVAIVGENGAGKSTLIKLLCRLYRPDAGRILVDGQDLARLPAAAWRERLAGAFQDFFRFEFAARQSVGVGDLPHLDDEPAVHAAVSRAGADDVVARLDEGLATQLGPNWPGGADLSFGQWQKLALARGFMRRSPLLLVLDEPTAALDAETEHALFERYAAAARGDGRITLLVSHRFSTVRMADTIVVLDGARVVETGSHAELMARNGRYAETYRLQAEAYR